MNIATDAKEAYEGELLTEVQWKKKGYVPKSNTEPHIMWPSKLACTSSRKGPSKYYYDYEVERER